METFDCIDLSDSDSDEKPNISFEVLEIEDYVTPAELESDPEHEEPTRPVILNTEEPQTSDQRFLVLKPSSVNNVANWEISTSSTAPMLSALLNAVSPMQDLVDIEPPAVPTTSQVSVARQHMTGPRDIPPPHLDAKKNFLCLAKNCNNNSLNAAPGVKFFKLPANPHRRETWIRALKSKYLLNVDTVARRLRICSEHFRRRDMYLKRTKKVRDYAIPFPDLDQLEKHSDEDTINNVDESATMKKIEKLMRQQKKLLPKTGARYSIEFKYFALNLHVGNPIAYKFLKPLFKLPPEKCLRQISPLLPTTVNQEAFEGIAAKLRCLPEEARYCSLVYGTMPLARHLYYNVTRDSVIGVECIDGVSSTTIATQAHVLTLRGLAVPWEQLVGYAFTDELTGRNSDPAYWIRKVVQELVKAGVDVMAIVTKEKAPFLTSLTMDHDIFFWVESTKVYHVYDVSAQLADLYEFFYNNTLNYKQGTASFCYIKQLYDLGKMSPLKLIPKVTEVHVKPSAAQLRSGKMAAEVFSRDVAAALQHCAQYQLMSARGRPTADFVEAVSELFHLFNSSPSEPSTEPFASTSEQLEIYERGKALLLHLMDHKKTKAMTPQNRLRIEEICMSFSNTLSSITSVAEELQACGIDKLYTKRLQSKPLATTLKQIRDLCPTRVPTPIAFVRAYSKVYLKQILDHSALARNQVSYGELLKKVRKNKYFPPPLDTPGVLQLPVAPDYQCPLPKNKPLLFITTYLASKVLQEHSCLKTCTYFSYRRTTPKADMLAVLRSYDGCKLFRIPDKFELYIQELEACFFSATVQPPDSCVGGLILKRLQVVPFNMPCPCFPQTFLLKYFTRLRLYHTLKFNNLRKNSHLTVFTPDAPLFGYRG